jgi:formylglycine-generating enzyme required for sulfatase activity
MDIPQLAADTAKFIAPYLPYLIAGTKLAAKAAIEKTGENFSDAVWKKAEELWGKLKPKVDATPSAQSAIEKAARKPEDPRVLGNLEVELEEIFEQDEVFAQSIQAGNYSIVVGRDVNNSIATIGNNNLSANNGGQITQITNHYTNAPQSDVEKEKAQNAFRSYLEKLRRHCNALPLAALGGDDADEDITLDKIYIELDTTQSKEILEEASEKERKGGISGIISRGETPISVMEVTAENKKMVLLGDAGAGKSTFVKELLALQAAVLLGEIKEPLTGIDPDLIPVLIVLRDLSPKLAGLNLGTLSTENQKQALSDAILEKIREEIKAAEFIPVLEKAFENGKVLLVLDGLDEVPQNLRGRVRQAVGALIQLHKIERLIITSRSRSYTGQAVFQNFQSYTIAPFGQEKITSFARAWYHEQSRLGHMNMEQAEKRAHDLAEASSGDDLIEMSSNPMMLTSIAIIHQKDIGLPRERVRLYQLIVDVLISRWQKHKTGEESFAPSQALAAFLKDDNRLRAALEILAYEAHRANYTAGNTNGDADLSRGHALTLLESSDYLGSAELASEFLDYVDQRSGLLVGKGGELEKPTSYSFPHRTIQEYLAGCYLVGKRNRGREFFKHAAEGDFWSLAALMGAEELFYNHKSTRDTLLDLTYHLCPETPPQNEQAERALLWSGQFACLFGNEGIESDAGNPSGGKEFLKRLIPRTVILLEGSHLPPRERAEAGNTLAKLGDPRVGVTSDFLFCEIPAGKFLMGSKEGEKDSQKSETPQFEYNTPCNYFMSRYPITNAQFDLFVEADGYKAEKYWGEAKQAGYWSADGFKGRYDNQVRNEPLVYGAPFNLSNHPVVGVTWYEAAAFCKWLTAEMQAAGYKLQVYDPKARSIREDERLKLSIVNRKSEIRLPSEAEWERAARGSANYRYPWNSDEVTPNHANYSDTNLNATSAVGAFPLGVNDYGLLDMSGNVWEWCATEWQKNYAEYLKKENNKPEGDVARVLRGGSYYDVDRPLRCSYRNRVNPSNWDVNIGFRVVCVSSPISL